MRKDQPRDSHGRFVKVQPKMEDIFIHIDNDQPYTYTEITTTFSGDPNLLENGMSLIRQFEAARGFTIKCELPEEDQKVTLKEEPKKEEQPAVQERTKDALGYLVAALLGVLAGLSLAGFVFYIMRVCH